MLKKFNYYVITHKLKDGKQEKLTQLNTWLLNLLKHSINQATKGSKKIWSSLTAKLKQWELSASNWNIGALTLPTIIWKCLWIHDRISNICTGAIWHCLQSESRWHQQRYISHNIWSARPSTPNIGLQTQQIVIFLDHDFPWRWPWIMRVYHHILYTRGEDNSLIWAQRLINLEIPVLVRSLKSSNVELG